MIVRVSELEMNNISDTLGSIAILIALAVIACELFL